MQMLTASVLLAVAGVFAGELSHVQVPSAGSLLAFAYLTLAGSVVAYAAYVWLLANVSTGLVSTFAYVNPVVAVALGAALLGEAVTRTTLAAGAAIVGAVVLILRSQPADSPPRSRRLCRSCRRRAGRPTLCPPSAGLPSG